MKFLGRYPSGLLAGFDPAEDLAVAALGIVSSLPLDERASTAARVRIEGHIRRIREQRHQAENVANAFLLLDEERRERVELCIQRLSVSALCAEAVRDRSGLPVVEVGAGGDMTIPCDPDYMTIALRCLLETACEPHDRIRVRGQGSAATAMVILALDRPCQREDDIRIEIARSVAEVHGGSLLRVDDSTWTLTLPIRRQAG